MTKLHGTPPDERGLRLREDLVVIDHDNLEAGSYLPKLPPEAAFLCACDERTVYRDLAHVSEHVLKSHKTSAGRNTKYFTLQRSEDVAAYQVTETGHVPCSLFKTMLQFCTLCSKVMSSVVPAVRSSDGVALCFVVSSWTLTSAPRGAHQSRSHRNVSPCD